MQATTAVAGQQQPGKLLTTGQAARFLGVSRNWVWRHCQDGTLAHKMIAGRIWLNRDYLESIGTPGQ